MFAYKLPGKQVGVSLIELMIASVIGLVLLSGVVTIFSSNNASTTMSAGMARVQENGGVALDIMSYGVRMSGFQGCLGESKVDIDLLANPSPTINFPDNAIWGSKIAASGSWNPARHVDLEKIATENMQLKPNTDVLYIQYGSANTAGLAANMTDSNADIVLERNPGQVQANDLMMITDCSRANVFRATDVSVESGTGITSIQHGANGNEQSDLTQVYPSGSATGFIQVNVMKFEAKAYFVAENGRTLPNGEKLYSLFELDTSTNPIDPPSEIIEGVEEFQVLYGINTQTDELLPANIHYVTADNVTNPAQIVSVQLGLVVSTASYYAQDNDTQIYDIAGFRVGPEGAANVDSVYKSDRRLRAAFNTTAQVRNRVQ